MSDEDKSLGAHWDGWADAARQYSPDKQLQLDALRMSGNALQHELEALRAELRARDNALDELCRAAEALVEWWEHDDATSVLVVIERLRTATQRARQVQRT